MVNDSDPSETECATAAVGLTEQQLAYVVLNFKERFTDTTPSGFGWRVQGSIDEFVNGLLLTVEDAKTRPPELWGIANIIARQMWPDHDSAIGQGEWQMVIRYAQAILDHYIVKTPPEPVSRSVVSGGGERGVS